jgi:hypothetical protein
MENLKNLLEVGLSNKEIPSLGTFFSFVEYVKPIDNPKVDLTNSYHSSNLETYGLTQEGIQFIYISNLEKFKKHGEKIIGKPLTMEILSFLEK